MPAGNRQVDGEVFLGGNWRPGLEGDAADDNVPADRLECLG
jgi:hypothetical protein